MQNFSTSSSSEDLQTEFRTRGGCHVKVLERHGCPCDNSVNVPIFERFSCEEVPQNFEEGKKLQYRDECLAAVTEKFQLFNKEQDLASLWESKKVERSGVR